MQAEKFIPEPADKVTSDGNDAEVRLTELPPRIVVPDEKAGSDREVIRGELPKLRVDVEETRAGKITTGRPLPVNVNPATEVNMGTLKLDRRVLLVIVMLTEEVTKAGKLREVRAEFDCTVAKAPVGKEANAAKVKFCKLVCRFIENPEIVDDGKKVRDNSPGKFRLFVVYPNAAAIG